MRIKLLDYMKGLSILTIVLMHFMHSLGLPIVADSAISFGGAGVHVFIFISGFSLFLSYNKRQYSYFGFIKKRFVKIYIPYIVAVLTIIVLSTFILDQEMDWGALLSHLLLYKMFNEVYMTSYGYHLWFISTIFQLYLIMPLINYLSKRISLKKIFIASIFISISWMCLITLLKLGDIIIWNSFFLQFIWEFVFGMYVCELYLANKLPTIQLTKLVFMTLFSLIVYALLALEFNRIGRNFNDFFSLFGYGGVCVLLYKLNLSTVNNGLAKLGTFSFSLYLYHMIILELFVLFISSYGINYNILNFILVIILSIAISIPINKFNNMIVKRLEEKGFGFFIFT